MILKWFFACLTLYMWLQSSSPLLSWKVVAVRHRKNTFKEIENCYGMWKCYLTIEIYLKRAKRKTKVVSNELINTCFYLKPPLLVQYLIIIKIKWFFFCSIIFSVLFCSCHLVIRIAYSTLMKREEIKENQVWFMMNIAIYQHLQKLAHRFNNQFMNLKRVDSEKKKEEQTLINKVY